MTNRLFSFLFCGLLSFHPLLVISNCCGCVGGGGGVGGKKGRREEVFFISLQVSCYHYGLSGLKFG